MEHQKVLNLLNEASDSKSVTRKWNIVNDQPSAIYGVEKRIIYSTKVLRYNLCDYNDAYLLVTGNITITGRNFATEVTFKKCAVFIKCITKIDGTTIDDTENLGLVMPMYKLLEYISN